MSKVQINRKVPGSGRTKGTLNKKTETLLEICERKGINLFEALLEMTKDPDKEMRFAAIKEACRYIYSQRRAVEVSGPDQGPIETKSRHVEELKNLLENGLNERRKI